MTGTNENRNMDNWSHLILEFEILNYDEIIIA